MKISIKKLVLSFFVIGLFIFYAIYQQQRNIGSKIGQPATLVASGGKNAATLDVTSKALSAVVTPSSPVTDIKPRAQTAAAQNIPVTPNTPPVVTTPSVQTTSGKYKNGEYVGQSADAYYGNIQVKAVIKNGQIVDVVFLDYPQDRNTSVWINTQAMPLLRDEAIQAQSAQVNIVSGATDSSGAFISSLSSALSQAL